MLRGLTARQFVEWVVYMGMHPFGEAREDIRHALLVQMVHNVAVKKEHQKPMKDFLLAFVDDDKKPQAQSRETTIRVLRAIAMAYSGPAKGMN